MATEKIVNTLKVLSNDWIDLIGTELSYAFERGLAQSIELGLYIGPDLMHPFVNKKIEQIKIVTVIDKPCSDSKLQSSADRAALDKLIRLKYGAIDDSELLVVPLSLTTLHPQTWRELTSQIVRHLAEKHGCLVLLAMIDTNLCHLFSGLPTQITNIYKFPISLYTDGGCTNPGSLTKVRLAAWAFTITMLGARDYEACDLVTGKQTNICAELSAVLQGLKYIKERIDYNGRQINVYTDSEYTILVVTVWIYKWLNDPVSTKYKTKKNTELILEIKYLYESLGGADNVKFIHVKGHAKEPAKTSSDWTHWYYNDRVDKLCANLLQLKR